MNSERKNEIGTDDGSGRVLKIREAAAFALKQLDQLRSGRRCVLHIRGVGGITAPDSIFFARENRRPSHAQSDRENHRRVSINPTDYIKSRLTESFLKPWKNHISRSDESPELVALPAGSYLVIARSNRQGDVGIRVAIKAGQLTVLDLDLGEGDGQTATFTRVIAPGGQLMGGSRVQPQIVTSQFYENLHELRNGK